MRSACIEDTHTKLPQRGVQRRDVAGIIVAASLTNAQTTQLTPTVRPKIMIVINPQHLCHIAAGVQLRFLHASDSAHLCLRKRNDRCFCTNLVNARLLRSLPKFVQTAGFYVLERQSADQGF